MYSGTLYSIFLYKKYKKTSYKVVDLHLRNSCPQNKEGVNLVIIDLVTDCTSSMGYYNSLLTYLVTYLLKTTVRGRCFHLFNVITYSRDVKESCR